MPEFLPTLAPANDLFPYDPCAICNLLLDEAGARPMTLSVMQTLLYFTYGTYLLKTKRPLMFGKFAALAQGPVNPAAQEAFSAVGDKPINFRMLDEDLLSRTVRSLEVPGDDVARDVVARVMRTFGALTAAQLLQIAMVPEGPWAATINKSRTSVVIGMRISDTVILERFKHHRIVLALTD